MYPYYHPQQQQPWGYLKCGLAGGFNGDRLATVPGVLPSGSEYQMQQRGYQAPQWSKLESSQSPSSVKSRLNPFAKEFVPLAARASKEQRPSVSAACKDEAKLVSVTPKLNLKSSSGGLIHRDRQVITYGRYSLPTKFINGAIKNTSLSHLQPTLHALTEVASEPMRSAALQHLPRETVSFHKPSMLRPAVIPPTAPQDIKTSSVPTLKPRSITEVISGSLEEVRLSPDADEKEIAIIFKANKKHFGMNRKVPGSSLNSEAVRKTEKSNEPGTSGRASGLWSNVADAKNKNSNDSPAEQSQKESLYANRVPGGFANSPSDICRCCVACMSRKKSSYTLLAAQSRPLTRDIGTGTDTKRNTLEKACNTNLTAINNPHQQGDATPPHLDPISLVTKFLEDTKTLSGLSFNEIYARIIKEPVRPTALSGKINNPLLRTLVELLREHQEDSLELNEIKGCLRELADSAPEAREATVGVLNDILTQTKAKPKNGFRQSNEVSFDISSGTGEEKLCSSAEDSSKTRQEEVKESEISDKHSGKSKTPSAISVEGRTPEVKFSDLCTFKEYVLIETPKRQDAATNTDKSSSEERPSNLRACRKVFNEQVAQGIRKGAHVASNRLTGSRKQHSDSISSGEAASEQQPKTLPKPRDKDARKCRDDVAVAVKIMPDEDFEDKLETVRTSGIANYTKRVTRSITNLKMLMCKGKNAADGAQENPKQEDLVTITDNTKTATVFSKKPTTTKATPKQDTVEMPKKSPTSSLKNAPEKPPLEDAPMTETKKPSGCHPGVPQPVAGTCVAQNQAAPSEAALKTQQTPKAIDGSTQRNNTKSYRLRRNVAEQRMFLHGNVRDDYLFK